MADPEPKKRDPVYKTITIKSNLSVKDKAGIMTPSSEHPVFKTDGSYWKSKS